MRNLIALFFRSALLLSISTFIIVLALSVKAAVAVNASDSACFSWKQNPASEEILGYRIYYGNQSRFNSDNSLKNNFSYTQFIDLTENVRCHGPDYSICEQIDSNLLECEDLFSDDPRCTLYNLSGKLYFTITAYSNDAEGAFTYEIKWDKGTIITTNTGGTFTTNLASLQSAVNLLLMD